MNIPGVLILLTIIGVTLLFSERMVKKGKTRALFARKMLHIAGVGGLAVSPIFFYDHQWLSAVALFFGVVLFFAVKKRLLATDLYHRESLGIALFPFSFLVLWLTWGKSAPHLVIYPMLILAFSDAAAAIAGGFSGKWKYNISGDNKSIEGSLAFAVTGFLLLWFLPAFLEGLHPLFRFELPGVISFGDKLVIIVLVSLVTAAAEGATSGGWDNVTVPLSAACMLAILPYWNELTLGLTLPLLGVLGILAWFAVKRKWLDGGGAIVALLLGFALWLGGGWPSLLLMGLFFISGSLIGKAGGINAAAADAKMGKPRDYIQVISNGGIAGLLVLAYGLTLRPFYAELFALSVAISTADTWSSEIGTRAGGKVIDIVGFRTMPAGVSGGISWQGTLAGLAGSFLIAVVAGWQGFGNILFVGLGGFGGMLADSLLGSTLQAKYRVQNQWQDECPPGNNLSPEKGLHWLNNDRVNLFSNLLVTILGGILLIFCG